MSKLVSNRWLLMLAMAFFAFSCDDDEAAPDPVASFQFEVDAANFLTIDFSNFSSDADTYSWDFGDGSTVSTEENPSHTYEATGTYQVTLIASKGTKASAPKTTEVVVTDPNRALTLLAGTTSKTWKLYRVGTSMSVGSQSNPGKDWPGLTNNGTRPCLYNQTFTFKRDGGYVFDDKGAFWAEYGVFNNVPDCGAGTAESCFDATVANMKNACGTDVSKWLSGTHAYTYNGSTGELTLSGLGAWIGIPKLGTTGQSIIPVSQVKTKISIEEKTGFDVMKVEFIYEGGNVYWPIYYASYSDASLEPELVTVPAGFGENLTNITPTQMTHTFESATSFVELASIGGGSIITVGQTDPAGGGTNVGKFERVAGTDYQEAVIKVGGAASPEWKDVTWTNMTTVTMDVYLPSTNTYGTLSKKVIIGLADQSATEQWWTKLIQYESAELALDQWVTVTFTLSSPSFASLGDTPAVRTDLDAVFINIGGAAHGVGGTFYIRNLKFFTP